MEQVKSLVDGEWKVLSGRRIPKVNPASGEVIHEVRAATSSELRSAVASSRKAFDEWRKTAVERRTGILKELSRLLSERMDEVSRIITLENGKPVLESNMEVMGAQMYADYYANEADRLLEGDVRTVDFPQPGNYEFRTVLEPLGVVAVIAPWNWPLLIPFQTILPAVLAGDTVVFKPSSSTPMVGQKVVELLVDAGLPRGVLNLVQGDGRVGNWLVRSDVDTVVFVGGTDSGRQIAVNCARGLKRVVLELGGSDPFIVLNDAHIEEAINGAIYGRFFSTGQTCVSAKRILVQREVFDEFVSKFSERASALRVGDGLDPSTDVGPLISGSQRLRVMNAVRQAVSKGAKLECGGTIPKALSKGFFYSPTVLTNVNLSMKVMSEEIFGPVAPVVPFKDEVEATRIANSTRYGLGASIWTSNLDKALEISREIKSGIVWVNDVAVTFPHAPWGGVKESGLGRHSSKYGLLELVNIRQICINRIREPKRMWWLPYGGAQ